MKNRKILAIISVLLLSVSLSGCGIFDIVKNIKNAKSDTEQVVLPDDSTGNEDEVSEKTNDEVVVDSDNQSDLNEEAKLCYENHILVGNKAVFLKNGNTFEKLLEVDSPYRIIDSFSSENNLVIYARSLKGEETLYVADKDLEVSKVDIPGKYKYNFKPAGIYDNKFYFEYEEYYADFTQIVYYDFNKKIWSVDKEYQSVVDGIADEYANTEIWSYGDTFMSSLCKYGRVFYRDINGVKPAHMFDESGNELGTVSFSKNAYLDKLFRNYLTYIYTEWDDDYHMVAHEEYLYDVKTGESILLADLLYTENLSFFDIRDGYVYFCQYGDSDISRTGSYDYYRVKIEPNAEAEYLFTFERSNMYDSPEFDQSVCNLTFIDDEAYILDDSGLNMEWYRLSGDFKSAEPVNLVDTEITAYKYGYLTYDNGEAVEDDYQYAVYKGVYFNFNDDIPHADVLNSKLNEINSGFKTTGKDTISDMRKLLKQREKKGTDNSESDDDSSDSYEEFDELNYLYESGIAYSYDAYFVDATNIGSHYLQLNYNDYIYLGGAHGMGNDVYYLFDLNDGKYITLKDICGVSEERLKEVVAEATINAMVNSPDLGFYEEYDYDRYDEFYSEYYDNADFNLRVRYTEDELVVMYPPYQYGPYSSGYIEIPIPYSDLDINIR